MSSFMSSSSEKRGLLPQLLALLLTRRGLHLVKQRRDPAALRGNTGKRCWRRIGAYCKQAKPQCPMALGTMVNPSVQKQCYGFPSLLKNSGNYVNQK